MATVAPNSLGPYEAVSLIGKGGMGEVWKGRDPRLNREVAIKVAAQQFTDRFEREARAIAALNHPNICTLFDVGPNYLVMELIEGPTLAERMAEGPMPIEEALGIAKQVAEAMEAAHEKGIVHRDLKPANIKIRPNGSVKVLDFRLAKAGEEPEVTSDSPTMMTVPGMILGTAGYMAPEQARGKKVDRRADIWAFGVVLYEMAAGGRLFEGDTVSDSLAAVIKADPDWTKIPARLERLLRACLQKEPQDRLQAIGDWKLLVDSEPIALSTPSRSRLGMGLGWIAAAVLLAALTLVYFRRAPELTAAPRQILTILPPTGINLRTVGGGSSPEISPDGSSVFEGSSLRRLDSLDMAPLPAMSNEGFWSPDSKSIVFPQGRMLKKMRVPDGAPETIAKLPNFSRGGSWSDKGSILVSSGNLLYVVPPGGGDLRTLEVPSLKQGVYEWPEFLPGSEEFMFFGLLPDSEEGEVYLATLNDGKATDPVALLRNATAAHFTPAGGGLVLFVRNDNLYAQKLNRAKRRLEGDPELVLQGVASGVTNASFSVSRSGTVAWRPGKAALSQWTTFDRKGKQTGISGPPGGQDSVSLSKDESHLLTSRGLESQAWLLEPDRPGRLGAGPGGWLFWYPDGLRLLGASTNALSERLVNGAGTLLKLADIPTDLHAQDVSPDGKLALLSGSNDLYSVRLDGPAVERVPKLAIQTGQRILNARFSPDGQWVVYSSGGLFVQPFPGPGFRKQISSTGSFAVWRKDGKEIVYYDQGQIWSIRVESVGSQQRFSALEALFRVRPPTWLPPPTRSLSRTTARASTSPKPSSSRTQT